MLSPIKSSRTKKIAKDSKEYPIVQISYLERTSDAIMAENYGVHTSPPIGTPCLMITVNNDEANKFVIPLSALTRPKGLQEGEAVFGNFKIGTTIKFDCDGNIIVTSNNNITVVAPGEINVTCPLVKFSGDIEVSGKSFLNHVHGGVVSGGSNTGVPV